MTNQISSPWTNELDEKLRSLLAANRTYSQIAAELNVTRSAVGGRIKRLKLSTPTGHIGKRSTTPEERALRTLAWRAKYNEKRRATPKKPRVIINHCGVMIGNGGFELPKLASVNVTPRNISLIDLKVGDCRWPYGDGPFTFCGCAAIEDKPYCLEHAAIAFRQNEERIRPYTWRERVGV